MNSEESMIQALPPLMLRRDEKTHKGDFGTLTVVAGSSYFRGAAALAVKAALRSGAGIVRLASVEPVIAAAAAKLDEVIFLPLKTGLSGGIEADDCLRKIATVRSDAVLAGCGMTDSPDTEKIVRGLLEQSSCPLVLDADALNSLKGEPSVLRKAAVLPIVTPHIGEMARLTGLSPVGIVSDREKTALAFAAQFHTVVVLKDYQTVVASPDGEILRAGVPNSGLAKGGSGDVLAGIVGSLLCQGFEPYRAACAGVLIHALAGQAARRFRTARGMLPSDLPDALPLVFGAVEDMIRSGDAPEEADRPTE